MRVYIELDSSNFIFVDDVEDVRADYPHPNWTLLTFPEDKDVRDLVSWLNAVARRKSVQYERFSYYYNGIALAPAYDVSAGRG